MKLIKLEPTEADIKRVVDLLVVHFVPEHKMGPLSAININLDKAVAWGVHNIQTAGWAVEDGEGRLVGSLALHQTTPWYGDTPYYTDGWFYVLPEYRKTGVGRLLLEEAQKFAKEKQLPLIVGVFNMEDSETRVQIMQKLGLKLVGGLFATGV